MIDLPPIVDVIEPPAIVEPVRKRRSSRSTRQTRRTRDNQDNRPRWNVGWGAYWIGAVLFLQDGRRCEVVAQLATGEWICATDY